MVLDLLADPRADGGQRVCGRSTIDCRGAGRSRRRYKVGVMRAVTIEISDNALVGFGQSTEAFAKEAKLLLFDDAL